MPFAAHWDTSAFEAALEWDATLGMTGPIDLHHAQYPYFAQSAAIDDARFNAEPERLIDRLNESGVVRDMAEDYLAKASPWLLGSNGGGVDLMARAGGFNTFPGGLQLAWLPLGITPDNASVVVRSELTTVEAGSEPVRVLRDVTLGLFAVQVWDRGDASTAFRNGMGLRIDATLRWHPGAGILVRIDGLSLSAGLLQAILRPAAQAYAHQALAVYLTANHLAFHGIGGSLAPAIAAAAGIDAERVVVTGLSTEPIDGNSPLLRVFALAMRPPVSAASPAMAVMATVNLVAGDAVVVAVNASPLVAHAAQAHLFAHDPGGGTNARQLADPASQAGMAKLVSARPNRSPGELGRFRYPVDLTGLATGKVPLRDPGGWFEVRRSRLVDRRADEKLVVSVNGADASLHARSNDFAAVSAYRQMCDLFAKINGFGLPLPALFRHLPNPASGASPIIVRYRATMFHGPGRDGKVVNAQVNFEPASLALGALWSINALVHEPVQIRFALADVRRSSSGREPLGLATDPRWSWHEFGHLLLAGSTGRLEFVFAHSAGDALAAIVSDPRSKLATGPGQPMPPMRGATYPWVPINRRHDKAVEQGWGWSGMYHRSSRFDPANSNQRHKGYDSEQILSTTLFRLYRALGGDTVDAAGAVDVAARQQASDYTVYLIMRAIAMMGSAWAVPVQTVAQFARLLSLADAVTAHSTTGLLKNRVGGCALKVIRWAFERQGLYAGVAADVVHDAVGRSPAVDVFINDRRKTVDPRHLPGEYSPVSLDAHSATPAWHADALAMVVDKTLPGAHTLTVTVGNRGIFPASHVLASAWLIAWPMGAVELPPWNRLAWTQLQPPAMGPQTIAPNLSRPFGPFAIPAQAPGRYLVLAECRALLDRSIIDQGFLLPFPAFWGDLPCAHGNTPLATLVAGDNNLALVVYDAT